MKISECYKSGRTAFSFEFFPPKSDQGEAQLFETVAQLKSLRPSFVSVTYGAMGTTRNNTARIVEKIQNDLGLNAAAHLTCIAHTRAEVRALLAELREKGIQNIVALRGDRPKDAPDFRPPADGFKYAADLVRFIRQETEYGREFSLAVAGYPEAHVECKDKEMDLEHLRRKVAEGADAVITQLFFDNRDYFDFVERARKAGIRVPIVPGIMPVTNGAQIQKFSDMCGAAIPAGMREAILQYGEDQASVEAYGIEYATAQCRDLLKKGVPGIHFYTLNKSRATRQICAGLGVQSFG
jgi:methylenetetrahydrofolate reductase (NADPH)